MSPWLFLCLLAIGFAEVSNVGGSHSRQFGGTRMGEITISDINVLLPYTFGGDKVEYRISASGGCFKWSTPRPDMLGVKPEYDPHNPECSTSALLYPASDKVVDARNKGALYPVYAQDTLSNQAPLRCEVFFALIDRVEILTTTRLMYKEELEVFSVQAFDAEDNYFTWLGNVHFNWAVSSVEGGETDILAIVPDTEGVEGISHGGYKVLVRAMETGKSYITVKLSEQGYSTTLSSTALITVHTPLNLIPKLPVYITPVSELLYTLQTKSGQASADVVDGSDSTWIDIVMPNPRYTWSTDDAAVADVDAATGLVWGVTPGFTLLHVHDVEMPDNRVTALIYVVDPAYIALSVVPLSAGAAAAAATAAGTATVKRGERLSNWYLVNGRDYEVHVDVFDADDNNIFITSNMKFEVDMEEFYFATNSTSASGDAEVVRTLNVGITTVDAALLEIHNARLGKKYGMRQPLRTHQKAVISSPVTVVPSPLVLLPWHATIQHTLELVPSGGSGEYRWALLAEGSAPEGSVVSVRAVGAGGLVAVHAVGEATVRVHDSQNSLNFASTHVIVDTPRKMRVIAAAVEAEVGSLLELHVALFTEDGRAFSNCSGLPVRLAVQNPAVFKVEEEGAGTPATSCRAFQLRAVKEGHTVVYARYEDLKVEVTVFAYPPLRVVGAPEGGVLVTAGSSWDFVFQGGPLGWPEASSRRQRVAAEDDTKVKLVEVEAAAGRRAMQTVVRVVCLDHGPAQRVTVEVMNAPCDDVPQPVRATASVTITCAAAHAIALLSDHEGDVAEECRSGAMPLRRFVAGRDSTGRAAAFHVRSGRAMPVTAVAVDAEGREFDNFTSLELAWATSDEVVARFQETEGAARVQRRSRHLLHLAETEGQVDIAVTATRYLPAALSTSTLSSSAAAAVVTDAGARYQARLTLALVHDVALTPARLLVFNHEDNAAHVLASGGSGRVSFSANNTADCVELAHEVASPQLLLRPLAVGTVVVTARDMCLDASLPAEAEVRVADVHGIRLRVRDKVQEGAAVVMEVACVDETGAEFDASQLTFMEIRATTDSDVVDLSPNDDAHSTYQVYGRAVGTARVVVTATLRSGRVVESDARHIHVFPPLEVVPRLVWLMCGGSQQISHRGGPRSHLDVAYTIEDPDIATVDPAGTVTALKVGETRLKAVASGPVYVDGPGGGMERVVFAQDWVPVRVSVLAGVRIVASTNTLVAGGQIVVHVEGSRGETPMMFGSSKMQYEWRLVGTGAEDVVSLAAVHPGRSIEEEADLSARVLALGVGQATVSVRVTAFPTCASSAVFEDSLQLHVEEPLQLVYPAPCTPTLLLPFSSTACIVTNKDNEQKLTYTVLSKRAPCADCPPGGKGRPGQTSAVTLSPNGCVSTGTSEGAARVLVEDASRDESVVVTVHVRAVDHVALDPPAAPAAPDGVAASATDAELPIGATALYRVALRDDAGRRFDECRGGVSVSVLRSHGAVVKVRYRGASAAGSPSKTTSSNATAALEVHGAAAGEAVVKAYVTATPDIATYLRVRVGQAIRPGSPVVHLGGFVSFSPRNDEEGTWSSADSSIVSIDAISGHAVANHAGRTSIFFTRQSTETTHTAVTVVKLASVSVDTSGVPLMTNVVHEGADEARNEYRIPVRFFGSEGSRLWSKEGSAVAHNVQLLCEVAEDAWAYATPAHDAATGDDFCVVTALSPSVAGLSDGGHASPVSSLTVLVSASDRLHTHSVAANATVPFRAAFSFRDAPQEIVLSAAQTSVLLEVVGQASVEGLIATSSDSAAVEVAEVPTSLTASSAVFKIAAVRPGRPFAPVTVEVLDYVTGQKERVRVRAAEAADGSTVAGDDDGGTSLYIIAAVAAVLFAVWYLCAPPRRPAYRPDMYDEAHMPPYMRQGAPPPPSLSSSAAPITARPVMPSSPLAGSTASAGSTAMLSTPPPRSVFKPFPQTSEPRPRRSRREERYSKPSPISRPLGK